MEISKETVFNFRREILSYLFLFICFPNGFCVLIKSCVWPERDCFALSFVFPEKED